MKKIAVSQRVDVLENFHERRDALDQRWYQFLKKIPVVPIPIPNNPTLALQMLHEIAFDGVLLTGGNDLTEYGGDSPERDETEYILLQWAISMDIPVLGVCRGMQLIQHFEGILLKKVEGHVQPISTILIDGQETEVNSFHHWGTKQSGESLVSWATAYDGVLKAVSHTQHPVHGIMWHPERFPIPRKEDLELFKRIFDL